MENFLRSSHLYLGTDIRNRHRKYIYLPTILCNEKSIHVFWVTETQKNLRPPVLLWYPRHFLSDYLRLGIKTKVTKVIVVLISRNLKKLLAMLNWKMSLQKQPTARLWRKADVGIFSVFFLHHFNESKVLSQTPHLAIKKDWWDERGWQKSANYTSFPFPF